MAKHKVECLEPFVHDWTVGALVRAGKEISPAEKHQTPYAAGQIVEFRTKKDAEGFVKAHGTKFRYKGKE